MGAKAETLAGPARHVASYVLAVALALVLGATAGSIITRTLATDAVTTRENVVGITPWDQQKLNAMAGRQQAEALAVDGPGIAAWDQGKLDAMAGRQQAEALAVDGPGIAAWDQGKLDAMEGFQASAGGGSS